MFQIHDFWGFVAVCLTLVLVYLILNNWGATNALGKTAFEGGNSLFRTLQGR